MNDQGKLINVWQTQFAEIAKSNDANIEALISKSRLLHMPAKQKVLMQGMQCNDYLLVAKGRIRVQFVTRSGREVVLYHVDSGHDCVLTTSCIFGGGTFPAEGITETEITVISIPASLFNETLQTSEVFRKFVFSTFSKRLTDVIARIEVLCTSSIEQQIIKALLYLGKNNSQIKITHLELAAEVGTVREVASRNLKKLETNQYIKLSRGMIELIDSEGLERLLVA